MKVLIAIDGSPASFAAVRLAGSLLSPQRDELAFFYSTPALQVARSARADPHVLEQARESLAGAVCDEAAKHLPESLRQGVERIVGHQPPRRGILVATDEWRAEMVVLGARGLGPVQAMLLGSVSRAVVHAATVPVLVVRDRQGQPSDAPLKVLLACDGSASSKRAGAVVARLSLPAGTTGRVVTVVESLMAGQLPDWLREQARETDEEPLAKALVEETEAEQSATREELTQFCTNLPSAFHGHPPIVKEGHAADVILGVVDDEQADLLVVGAHDRSPVSRFLLGGTSEKLLSAAPCSVLVVPQHEEP